MTQLIVRAVDDEIKNTTDDIVETNRLKALEAKNDEIIAKLDALYAKNAEIVKNDASVNDGMVQDTLIALLRAKGDARDDDLAEWMNMEHDFITDVLSVMKDAGKVKIDKTYGTWSLS
jgi:hypothetical protein